MIIIIIFNEGLDQYMKKQEIQNIGLDTLPVLFTDTSLNSSNYFNVIDIPQRFTAGKNIIKLLGNQTNLEPSAPVYIEILDANKKPIYHEVLDYQDDDGTVCIRINITDDVVPGNCELYIATRATNIPELQLYDIPTGDVSNIKWNRQISVSPTSLNSNDILFVSGSLPKVDITEKITPYFAQSYKTTRLVTVTGSSTVKLLTPGSKKKSIPSNLTTTGQNRIGNTFLYKVVQPNPSIIGNRKTAIASVPIVIQNNTMPTLQVISGNFVFSSSMVGGTITINNPTVESSDGNIVAGTTYTSTIVKVINETTANVADELDFTYNDSLIRDFSNSLFTCSYVDTPILTETENFQSYIDINMYNIVPAAGSVHKVRTYMKPVGSAGEYRMINETVLTQQDILIDTGSLSGENKIGEFTSLSDITAYWSSSLVGPDNLIPIYDSNYKRKATDLKVTYSRNVLNDSMQLDSLSSYTEGDFAILKLRDNYFQTFYKNDMYVVSIDTACKVNSIFKSNKQPEALKYIPDGWIDVYVSGSAFNSNVSLDTDSIQTNSIGKYIGSIYLNDEAIIFDNLIPFAADNDGTGTVLFAIRSGDWYISNVHIYPDASLGYNPSRILLRLPVPTISINAEQQFKFQYFDYQGNPADYETEVFGPVFAGGNTYIEGDQNVLTGSLSVGGGIGKGFDIVGDLDYAWSGLHGYDGFDNAVSGSGSPGVATWSGSTTIGSTTYDGIGFELASEAYYLRFSGNNTSSGSLSIKAGSITVDSLIVSGGISLAGFTSSYWTGSSDGSIKRVSNVVVTGSLTVVNNVIAESFTGSLFGTSSWAISSSIAITSSYVNTLNQDLTFNGNLTLNGTASIAYLNVSYESASVIYSSGSNQLGDATNDVQTLIGSTRMSGSLSVSGSSSFTGPLSIGDRIVAASASRDINLLGTNAVIRVVRVDPTLGNSPSIEFMPKPHIDSASAGYWDVSVRHGDGSFRIRDRAISTAADRFILSGSLATVSASMIVTGSVTAPAFTGSLFGTSSWAVSSSYAYTASMAPLYLPLVGGTMSGDITFSDDQEGVVWSRNTDGASIKFYNTGDGDTDSRLEFQTLDNNNEYFRWTHNAGGTTYESMRIVPNGTNNATMTVSGSMITTGNIGAGIGAFGSLTAKVNISASGNGAELLRFETERAWRFLQSGSAAAAALELNCLANNKTFKITSVNRSSSFEVNTADADTDKVIRMLPDANDGYVTIGHRSAQSGMIFDVSGSTRLRGSLNVGVNTTASGLYSYAGGSIIAASGDYSFIHAYSASIDSGSSHGSILGSTYSTIKNPSAMSTNLANSILGGNINRIADASYSTITGGDQNTISGSFETRVSRAAIVAGYGNTITNTASSSNADSFILGGQLNTIRGATYSGIFAGNENTIADVPPGSTGGATILSGNSNRIINTDNSSIIGGQYNLISGSITLANVIILGTEYLTASLSNTVYVPNLVATGSLTIGSSSMGPAENTLTLGARDTGDEGGQLGFNAPGGTYTSASMIDNYQNKLRILKGTNAGTTTELVSINLHSGNFGIGTSTPGYRLEIGVDSAAKPSTNTWTISSDIRLKDNIAEANYDTCYDIVKNLPLKRYTWKQDVYTDEQVADRSKLGWIAQDVETVFPKAVAISPFSGSGDFHIDDCLSMNADQIYAAMYGTIKKLIVENELLKSELQTIKTHLGL
jgi:hypothetical protein